MPVSLTERLKEIIRREGAIPFRDWMEAALYDPLDGYYQRSNRERWGRAGDYRTSPERSNLFAATFARYFASLHEDLGSPKRWTIVECGAGDGRFAAGVLRTLRNQFPAVFTRTLYVVQDVSDDARRRARERLREFPDGVEFSAELPAAGTGIYFANELLDAFSVHRVVQRAGALSEMYVTLKTDGNFGWSTGLPSTPRLAEFFKTNLLDLADGQIVEVNLEIDDWLKSVSGKLDEGFVINVDYGAESGDLYDFRQRPEGTLRGFARHSFVADVLDHPGECDLTSSVNWTQVRRTGAELGLKTIVFASQDKFLLQTGFLDQMEYQISLSKSDAEKLSLTTAAREMILPGAMASSFQVLVQKQERRELS